MLPGGDMGGKEQGHQPALAGLIGQVFPQCGDAQGQGGVGFVHAPFFAQGSLSTPLNKVARP